MGTSATNTGRTFTMPCASNRCRDRRATSGEANGGPHLALAAVDGVVARNIARCETSPYDATTMFVRFRERQERLQVSVVQARRVDGKVRHEHVASFGSVPMPASV